MRPWVRKIATREISMDAWGTDADTAYKPDRDPAADWLYNAVVDILNVPRYEGAYCAWCSDWKDHKPTCPAYIAREALYDVGVEWLDVLKK